MKSVSTTTRKFTDINTTKPCFLATYIIQAENTKFGKTDIKSAKKRLKIKMKVILNRYLYEGFKPDYSNEWDLLDILIWNQFQN